MKNIKKISCLLMLLIVTVTLVGCVPEMTLTSKYDTKAQFYSYDVNIVAENENYQLIWDDSIGDISFKNKINGSVWTTRSYKDENNSAELTLRQKTPIIINYIEKDTFLDKVLNAYQSSLSEGSFSAQKIENGIKVTYYFPKVELAVPVNYVLTDSGFQMNVDPTKIQENGNRIYSISFMPFMCSVNNNSSPDDNYIFNPSGSGALIYPKTTDDGAAISLSDSVYGNDAMNGETFSTKSTDIKLPVFGVKNGDNAMFGIINRGAENSQIDMIIGSSSEGYSTIYPTFNIRGNYTCITKIMRVEKKDKIYSDSIIKSKIGVTYIPLSGNDANYVGMANTYRRYLENTNNLKKANNDNLLNIKFVGGIMSKKFTFGVPHQVLNVLTDFNDVATISQELNEKYSTKLNVNLIGFSKTGITLNEIAGGYTYNKKFGSINDINDLDKDRISLFFDFDVLRFSENGSGISNSDAALNVSKQFVPISEKDFVSYSEDLSSKSHYLVSRVHLMDIIEKSVNKLNDWKINGIGLSSLSSVVYSDYTENLYTSKDYMASQTEALLKGIDKSKLNIATSSANDYAANYSTHIFDVPTSSKSYQIFDCEIPFYQIVYKGYRSMSTSSINLVDNIEKEFLKSVESGVGLTYTLTNKYDSSLINSRDNLFYNSKYSAVKSIIESNMNEYSAAFKIVENQGIINHTLITQNVRVTEFENGAKIAVNYGDKDYLYGDLQIPACGFLIMERGE